MKINDYYCIYLLSLLRKWRFVYMFFLVLLSCVSVYAQQNRNISGKVMDEKGEMLPGVSIMLKGTSRGTMSDANGAFSISVSSDTSVLIFSFVGYESQEIPVKKNKQLRVIMTEDVRQLNEVVVMGYGSFSRKDVTGSVAKVDMDELSTIPVSSFSEALEGRVAGVQIQASDGQPGETPGILIRGNNSLTQDNSPLYVVDGFPMEDFDAASISNDDIESLNILKDASATAIYGARAANGVVVITTKKGRKSRPIISFSASLGWQEISKQMEMMSPYEFVRYNLELKPDITERRYLSGCNMTLDDYKNMKGINWQDEIQNDCPLLMTYNLSIRGGNDRTKYSVSGSTYNQNGVIDNSGYDRYTGRVSLDQRINRFFSAGLNAGYTEMTKFGQNLATGDTESNSTTYLLYRTWAYRPVGTGGSLDILDEIVDEDNLSATDVRINPVLSNANESRKTRLKVLTTNAYLEAKPLSGLTIRITGALNKRMQRRETFNNSKTTQGSPLNKLNTRGQWGSVLNDERSVWSNENTVTYNKTFSGAHHLNAVAGFSVQGGRNTTYGSSAILVPNEELGIDGLSEGTPYTVTSDNTHYTMASFFGRVNYSLYSRYLFTFTFRGDGSSRFAPGNRWGYFPSGAFAWNFSEEPFMKRVSFISTGKLRTSYGETGNNRVSDFSYYPSIGLPIASCYSFNNGTPTHGFIPSGISNSELKWERTGQFDIGVDLGFFRDRVQLTVDWYQKITRDLLLLADLPYTMGFESAYENVGKMRNRGLEISLKTVNVKTRNFRWESDFNISFNRNKILSLTGNQRNLYSFVPLNTNFNNSPLYVAQVGQPTGMFFGYVFDGIYQEEDFDQPSPGKYILKDNVPTNGNERSVIQPGDIKYRDLNGDGVVNTYDQTIIGRGQPLHTGGFNNTFTYKGFSLGIFLSWSYGNDVYNANRLFLEGNALVATDINQYKSYENRWTPENRSNKYFRTGGQGPAGYHSSRVLEDGSYLRLQNLTFGYNFPRKCLKRIYLSSLNLSFTARNLVTFTGYSGMDPSVSTRSSILTPSFDYSAYPSAKSFMFSLKTTF